MKKVTLTITVPSGDYCVNAQTGEECVYYKGGDSMSFCAVGFIPQEEMDEVGVKKDVECLKLV